MRNTYTVTSVECDLCRKYEPNVANIEHSGWFSTIISSIINEQTLDICEECGDKISKAFRAQQLIKDEVPF